MTELIVVMVIIGILAAVAIPRLVGSTRMASPTFRSDALSALRYAQKVAISHRRVVCAALTANAVTLTIASNAGGACNTNLNGPDGAHYISASNDPAVVAGGLTGTLYFQPTGLITTDSGGSTAASGTMTITGADAITVEGATGYVE
jgi:MSHA pilin protein MshC